MAEFSLALVDWSRAQFALTALYHWIFVPLTLGLSFIVAFMHTIYYKTLECQQELFLNSNLVQIGQIILGLWVIYLGRH